MLTLLQGLRTLLGFSPRRSRHQGGRPGTGSYQGEIIHRHLVCQCYCQLIMSIPIIYYQTSFWKQIGIDPEAMQGQEWTLIPDIVKAWNNIIADEEGIPGGKQGNEISRRIFAVHCSESLLFEQAQHTKSPLEECAYTR